MYLQAANFAQILRTCIVPPARLPHAPFGASLYIYMSIAPAPIQLQIPKMSTIGF